MQPNKASLSRWLIWWLDDGIGLQLRLIDVGVHRSIKHEIAGRQSVHVLDPNSESITSAAPSVTMLQSLRLKAVAQHRQDLGCCFTWIRDVATLG